MNHNHLDLTPEQLTVYTELQRIRMAWVTLAVVLILFAIGLLSFLYAVFWVERQDAPKVILGGIDGVLGWALKTIISYLFPSPQRS
jgi:hypothetical protein